MAKGKVKAKCRFATPLVEYDKFRERLITLLESDPDSFSLQYQRKILESKLMDPRFSDPPSTRRTRAIEKWYGCEEKNDMTNSRMWDLDVVLFKDITAERFLQKASQLIETCIGQAPDFDLLRGSFSNGASTGIRREPGSIGSKYIRGSDITKDCIPHFEKLNCSEWWIPEYNIVPGNVLFTVPKSVTIDRCSAKEPDLNMYVQKAVGDFLRHSLRRKGINLNDQTINQRLACEGSITGQLATIDLSSASDTIASMLVGQLVPSQWFSLLLDIRSPSTLVDGEWHDNHMMSSMGNAFTFELESLIFWALSNTVKFFTGVKGKISVFGDDIICPVGMVGELETVFTFCGFQFNSEKSFWEGPFRESCGKHYHAGRDVTPFYIRKVPSDATDWIHILNKLRGWLERHAICEILDPDYYQLWKDFSQLVPEPVKGGWDYDRRDILVSPGRRPLAALAPVERKLERRERELQLGLYWYWLDASDQSPALRTQRELTSISPRGLLRRWLTATSNSPSTDRNLLTSAIITDGELRLKRQRKSDWSYAVTPRFPQEWGVLG